MLMGTWGEWVGAAATFAATLVALWFGVRDDVTVKVRRNARREIRGMAGARLRAMEQWRAGVDDPDGREMEGAPKRDQEATAFVRQVDGLGTWRRERGTHILRAIYGERAVRVAKLVPERDFSPEGTMALLSRGPQFAVDGAPLPLRVRGAVDVKGSDFAKLERQFRRLARL
ncbi:MAG: hypothetical protein HHJ10_01200 [Cellulomonas sp.]|uniref:hypothetical protein n=1 Tax=Cellulomonas sp. TaxID=40001 RepID=UPI0018443253|nr:hypothetical protein [Cellulomonas sp.]NMM29686.1 hypothetical protein [Cellulomonas sp.]